MRIDLITLKKMVPTLDGGFRSDVEDESARITCWATKKDATRSEYYNALAAGIQVEAVFDVSPIDYAGHTHLVHGDTEYRIVRAYHIPGTDNTELTCTKG